MTGWWIVIAACYLYGLEGDTHSPDLASSLLRRIQEHCAIGHYDRIAQKLEYLAIQPHLVALHEP